jgi:hypothetical protein
VSIIAKIPPTAAYLTPTDFTGYGEAFKPATALSDATNDAKQQATAKGFTACETIASDVTFDQGADSYFATVTIHCTPWGHVHRTRLEPIRHSRRPLHMSNTGRLSIERMEYRIVSVAGHARAGCRPPGRSRSDRLAAAAPHAWRPRRRVDRHDVAPLLRRIGHRGPPTGLPLARGVGVRPHMSATAAHGARRPRVLHEYRSSSVS